MTLAESIEQAIRSWERQGVTLLPPADKAGIVATFGAGHDVSEDVIQLYETVGGFADYTTDRHMWSLWSLDRIRAERSSFQHRLVPFADFLICSFLHSFRYENAQLSSVWIDHYSSSQEPYLVANSVAGFLELYVTYPERLELFCFDTLASES